MNKTKFFISEDRTYVLDFGEGVSIEVTGLDIMAQFRRQAILMNIIREDKEESQ